MKKSKLKTYLLITALILTPQASQGFWQDPWPSRTTDSGYSFEGFTQNFFSDSNYTASGGEYVGLPQNGRYFTSRNRITGAYTLKTGIQLRSSLDLTLAGIESDTLSESAMSLSGWNLGLVYPFLKHKNYSLLWELSGQVNLDPVEAGRAEPLGHDGVHSVRSHLRLARSLGIMGLYTQQGFYLPTEGLAGLWYWNVGAEFSFQQLKLSGQLEGHNTVVEDDYASQPSQRSNILGGANGGSFAFYTVNPQRFDFRAIAEFELTNTWSLPVSLLKTLNGQHSAGGFELAAGLRWHPGKAQRKRLRPEDFEVDRPNRTKKVPEFGEDGEPLEDAERLMEDRFRQRK